jgi:hypothetical protein
MKKPGREAGFCLLPVKRVAQYLATTGPGAPKSNL